MRDYLPNQALFCFALTDVCMLALVVAGSMLARRSRRSGLSRWMRMLIAGDVVAGTLMAPLAVVWWQLYQEGLRLPVWAAGHLWAVTGCEV
jgi:hypothetical protein